jgi:4-hydroxy-2-oxoheptanedioate aldolase
MRKNKMRELLREGKSSIGTHVLNTWPSMVEVIGETGLFDYVQFDGEYAPYDLYALENFARAVDLFDHMSSVFKVDQEPRIYLAQRAIGSGFQNLLFADIRSIQDAEQCVRAVRPETPEGKGILGCHMRRDVGFGREGG